MTKQPNETRRILAAQEKVPLIIFPKHEDDNTWIGAINGVRYMFPKGQTVEVPRDLAAMIAQNDKVVLQAREREKAFKSLDLSPAAPAKAKPGRAKAAAPLAEGD